MNELTSLRLKREQMEKSIGEKEKLLSQCRLEYDEDRKDLEKKIENYKNK